MLEALRVRNLGAVDDVAIELDGGLTVLTGETGAGKTLLIEALHLVLGGKDRSLPIRDPGSPSRVEAVFATESGAELVLAREVTTGGRLRASIDGAMSSAQSLAELAGPLCELHGQHEHLVLRSQDAARRILDRSASIDDAHVRDLRGAKRVLLSRRERLGGTREERARRLELVAHECAEIDAVAPAGPGEIDALLEEVRTLSAIVESKEALMGAAQALDADEGASAAQLLGDALALLPRAMDEARAELAELAERSREAAGRLRRDVEALREDPGRLQGLDERLARLQALVRKHGHSLSDVLERRDALGAELDLLRSDEAASEELDGELSILEAKLADAEADLAQRRHAAAIALGAAVRARLAPLALPHARFEVSADGPAGERVTFLFAGSEAFDAAPLGDAASGGELSRVMLALTLASNSGAATMVFDEVDAGVGGATARSLAACLSEVARERQVIVVTHLATVAAAAAHHLVVARGALPSSPASVAELTGEPRVREVARMLAGDPSDPVAIAHARALLDGDPAAP